nr:hypothetical protein [Tanacetum cinerariifolium]
MEEMDIKWNMALLSMRADKFWKRTEKKISIQGSDVAGFDKSKVECFNCHKMGHFARECRAPRSHDRGRRDNFRQGSKAKEQAPKALMAIDGVGWDWSYMTNNGEDHALVADEEAPTEFALMANTGTENKVFDNSLCSKDCKKNNDSLNRYTAIPPPSVQLYLSPKKDLSWTGLPECADDTVVDYSRPSPTVERPDFVMKKKACFNCGDFNHFAYDCRKKAHSYGNRPFHRTSAVRSPYRPPWVPTVNRNFPTANRKFSIASRKFPTGSTKSSTADMGIKGKA